MEKTACEHEAPVRTGATATAVYEAHRGGFRMTVHSGVQGHRYQVLDTVGSSAEDVVAIARAWGLKSSDVEILPAQP